MKIPSAANPEADGVAQDYLEPSEYSVFQAIHEYAQTNIQLYKQLKAVGYSFNEINQVRKAYDLATDLFASLYCPSGKTYWAHIVGVGSILGSLHLPIHVVAAGLLYDVCKFGDFGKGWTLDQKTHFVQQAVGKEIFRYIEGYQTLAWAQGTIQGICNQCSHLGPFEREVLLIRLARDLEEVLDWGILFCPDAEHRRQHLRDWESTYVEVAESLGYANLGLSFNQATSNILELPSLSSITQIRVSQSTEPFRLLPPSFTYGPFADFQKFMGKWVRGLTGISSSSRCSES